jgi:hypothetical protein
MSTYEISGTDVPCPACKWILEHMEQTQGPSGPEPREFYECPNPNCERKFDMHMDELRG